MHIKAFACAWHRNILYIFSHAHDILDFGERFYRINLVAEYSATLLLLIFNPFIR